MRRNPENMTLDAQGKIAHSDNRSTGGSGGQRAARLNKGPQYIWALLCILGVAFIVLGAAQGEVLTVLRKAAAICLECIGIG